MASIIYSHTKETLTYGAECHLCRVAVVVENIPASGFGDWVSGRKAIHEALPMLTPGQREMLLTEICEPCFDGLMEDRDKKECQK